jgi:hypothetical protein
VNSKAKIQNMLHYISLFIVVIVAGCGDESQISIFFPEGFVEGYKHFASFKIQDESPPKWIMKEN